MQILKATSSAVKKGAEIIKKGGLVAFPTETVYGLGASVFNSYSIAKIFEVKNRPYFDPLIVHISDFSQLNLLVLKVNPKAKKLMKKFWPGPLTIILPKSKIVPDIVTAGLKTVAIRMPSHPVAQALIQASEVPIAAPSANPFGYLSPTTAQHVKNQLAGKIELILDGGKCNLGIESTVIYVKNNEASVLRYGAIPLEDIEKVIGKVTKLGKRTVKLAPGLLPKHYSPRTPLKILTKQSIIHKGQKIGLLAFRTPQNTMGYKAVEVLSRNGNLIQAAANLFDCLHRLDSLGLDFIYAEKIKAVGLGRAIMDRLRKASFDATVLNK